MKRVVLLALLALLVSASVASARSPFLNLVSGPVDGGLAAVQPIWSAPSTDGTDRADRTLRNALAQPSQVPHLYLRDFGDRRQTWYGESETVVASRNAARTSLEGLWPQRRRLLPA